MPALARMQVHSAKTLCRLVQPLAQCYDVTYVAQRMTQQSINANRLRPARLLDKLGIGLAGLCALHCVATVVLVSILGVGGHFLFDAGIHRVGLALALAIAAVAMGWGALRHDQTTPIVMASAGLAFMSVALLVPHGDDEIALTLIGVALVSVGHFLNMRAPVKR